MFQKTLRNFATTSHRVAWFSPKCWEMNTNKDTVWNFNTTIRLHILCLATTQKQHQYWRYFVGRSWQNKSATSNSLWINGMLRLSTRRSMIDWSIAPLISCWLTTSQHATVHVLFHLVIVLLKSFYRAMRCISAVFAVMQCLSVCPSVRPSVTFVDHVKTNKHIFEIFHHRVATPF